MNASSRARLHATFVAAACLSTAWLCLVARAQETEDTAVRTHITVTERDITAAANVKTALFHAMPAHIEGAKERVSAMHVENEKRAADAGIERPKPAAVTQVLSSPYFYPGDLTKGAGPDLPTTTQHAVYVDYTGTVAANWGNPEGFLKDLNASTFVHLLDQYVGSIANSRYPVGGNAGVTYSFYGNVLYEHELWAIVHPVAAHYGTGGGHVYHVFLRKGLDVCMDVPVVGGASCYSPDNSATWAFCAYHTAVTFSDIGTVLFTVEPYQNVPGCAVATPSPNGQLADSTNSVLSHETFETITDPLGTAWWNHTHAPLGGFEIGDECVALDNSAGGSLVPTFKINGKNYEVQLEYSNTYHACAAQP
jgi:hypothetical protein